MNKDQKLYVATNYHEDEVWTSTDHSKIQEHGQKQRKMSHTILMPQSHRPRTNSEEQLIEDMATAERRDLCMFTRVVNGIRNRQLSNFMRSFECADGTEIAAISKKLTSPCLKRTKDHQRELPKVGNCSNGSSCFQYTHATIPPSEPGTRHFAAEMNLSQQRTVETVRAGEERHDGSWPIPGYTGLHFPLFDTVSGQESLAPVLVVEDSAQEVDEVFLLEL